MVQFASYLRRVFIFSCVSGSIVYSELYSGDHTNIALKCDTIIYYLLKVFSMAAKL